MKYGFENGKQRAATEEEIFELICITTDYIAVTVQDYLARERNNTRPVLAFATFVDWKADETNEFLHESITFLADIQYSDGGPGPLLVNREDVFDAFDLTEEEVAAYITDYVWTTSASSVFYDTVRVNYNVRQNGISSVDPSNTERIPIVSCGNTRLTPAVPGYSDASASPPPTWSAAPTLVPTVSVAPSMAPSISQVPSFETSMAPTTLVPVTPASTAAPTMTETVPESATKEMVYFRLDITASLDALTSDEDEEDTTILDTIQLIMCHTNSFIQKALQATLENDGSVKSRTTNISWLSSQTSSATIVTIFFTLDAVRGTNEAETIPTDVVVSSITATTEDKTNTNQALMDHYLQVSDNNSDRFMRSITESILQDLPEGTPVRVGRMQLAECPSVSPVFAASSHLPVASYNQGEYPYDEPAMQILLEFMVTNLNFVTSPNAVLNDGLVDTFPIFMKFLIPKLQQAPANSSLRSRRVLHDYGSIDLVDGSAKVYQATEVECPAFVHPDSICHTVRAKFQIHMPVHSHEDGGSPEGGLVGTTINDASDIRRIYQVGTYRAILDGTYYQILKQERPDTAIYIGTVPPPPEDANDFLAGVSTADWLIVILFILLAIACCLILGCICHRVNENRQERVRKEEEDFEIERLRQEEAIQREMQAQQKRRDSLASTAASSNQLTRCHEFSSRTSHSNRPTLASIQGARSLRSLHSQRSLQSQPNSTRSLPSPNSSKSVQPYPLQVRPSQQLRRSSMSSIGSFGTNHEQPANQSQRYGNSSSSIGSLGALSEKSDEDSDVEEFFDEKVENQSKEVSSSKQPQSSHKSWINIV